MGDVAEKKLIIIVEDSKHIAEMVKSVLNAEPAYQAVAVDDGVEAIEIIRVVKPSLVLLDVMLPGLDGFQVYDMLKADPATSAIPIIFVTASTFHAEFQKRNIDRHITKPFEISTLLATVAETVK